MSDLFANFSKIAEFGKVKFEAVRLDVSQNVFVLYKKNQIIEGGVNLAKTTLSIAVTLKYRTRATAEQSKAAFPAFPL